MTRYAEGTQVDASRSVAELERTVERYGATAFAYGRTAAQGMVSFEMRGRRVRFIVPLPVADAREFRLTATGLTRSQKSTHEAWQQGVRQRWRALLLVVKAKLEAIESGIAEFDREFLPYIVLPDGRTVGETVGGQLDEALRGGALPSLLPGLPSAGGTLLLGPAEEV